MRGGCGREAPYPEVEAVEGGATEDVVGERHVERPRAVDEDELLHAFGGERLDPARELPLAGGVGVVAADEVDSAEGSGVRGDGAGDGGGERRRVGARGLAEALEDAREEVRDCVSARASGVQLETGRQRRESTEVRAASLAGRRETMLRRSPKGRALMRSSASPEEAGSAERAAPA